MYARGMNVREIQAHLLELYGLQVSPDLISTITGEVLAEVGQWQCARSTLYGTIRPRCVKLFAPPMP